VFTELHQYFDAERHAGLLAAALGLASMGLASYLWFGRSPFKAMAWPLVVIGMIELGVGVGLVIRTNPQVQTLEAGLRASPQATAASELARMIRVNRSFRLILGGEVVLIITSLSLALMLRTQSLTWSAVGMGLLLQAAITLVFDLFAEHRAHVYTRWLSTLVSPGA
jgi:hypothetical protein